MNVWKTVAEAERRWLDVNTDQAFPKGIGPIHGSVLVHNDSIIISAGRNSYVDGGIYITRLDPRTGKKLD
jgi:hypothetical protein